MAMAARTEVPPSVIFMAKLLRKLLDDGGRGDMALAPGAGLEKAQDRDDQVAFRGDGLVDGQLGGANAVAAMRSSKTAEFQTIS